MLAKEPLWKVELGAKTMLETCGIKYWSEANALGIYKNKGMIWWEFRSVNSAKDLTLPCEEIKAKFGEINILGHDSFTSENEIISILVSFTKIIGTICQQEKQQQLLNPVTSLNQYQTRYIISADHLYLSQLYLMYTCT